MRKSMYALGILGLSSLLFAACGGSNSQDSDTDTTTTTAGNQDTAEDDGPDIPEIDDDAEMPIEPLVEEGPEIPEEGEPPVPSENTLEPTVN